MKKLLMVLFFLYLPIVAFSYDLDGTISDNGDGTYDISAQNEYGHEYNGDATDNGDGTMDVSLEDDNGESYSGTATDNADGTYDLDLQNDSSGGDAQGTLSADN